MTDNIDRMSRASLRVRLDHAKAAYQLRAPANQLTQILNKYRADAYRAVQSSTAAAILGSRATCGDPTRVYQRLATSMSKSATADLDGAGWPNALLLERRLDLGEAGQNAGFVLFTAGGT
jgi:hypothetical protein